MTMYRRNMNSANCSRTSSSNSRNRILLFISILCLHLLISISNTVAIDGDYSNSNHNKVDKIPDFMQINTPFMRNSNLLPSVYHSNKNDNTIEVAINTIHTSHASAINQMMQSYNKNRDRNNNNSTNTRQLQQLNPNDVCEGYNNNNVTKGVLECTCTQYRNTSAIAVNCSYIEPQCSPDKMFCFTGYIDSLITGTNNRGVIFNVTTSCSTITTSKTPETVCIRVFPNTIYNNYTDTIGSCSVTYNNTICNSCEQCIPDPNTITNLTYINNTHISINCCNVVPDKIQTCSSISENGATVQLFDIINPANAGQCTSSAYTTSITTISSMFSTITSAIIIIVSLYLV